MNNQCAVRITAPTRLTNDASSHIVYGVAKVPGADDDDHVGFKSAAEEFWGGHFVDGADAPSLQVGWEFEATEAVTPDTNASAAECSKVTVRIKAVEQLEKVTITAEQFIGTTLASHTTILDFSEDCCNSLLKDTVMKSKTANGPDVW